MFTKKKKNDLSASTISRSMRKKKCKPNDY